MVVCVLIGLLLLLLFVYYFFLIRFHTTVKIDGPDIYVQTESKLNRARKTMRSKRQKENRLFSVRGKKDKIHVPFRPSVANLSIPSFDFQEESAVSSAHSTGHKNRSVRFKDEQTAPTLSLSPRISVVEETDISVSAAALLSTPQTPHESHEDVIDLDSVQTGKDPKMLSTPAASEGDDHSNTDNLSDCSSFAESRRRRQSAVKLELALFNAIGENEEGTINFDTFFSLLQENELTAGISEQDALAMFNEMDAMEDDGQITFEEWIETRNKHRQAVRFGKAPSMDMSFEGISCVYEKKNAPAKQVLFEVSGYIPAGSFVALMGPSGAGKSTLLDILAMRKTTGNIYGSILVNGQPRNAGFLRQVAYVTQEDLFLPHMTVMEVMMYYAKLRLPSGMTSGEMEECCRSIIHQMGLAAQIDYRVGGPLPGGITLRGLSGGQKRRLSIACALIANPSILFLDEPTSGLDSFSALTVMETMRSLSRNGVTIICTIHQPRTNIWRLFDQLLLTAMGRLLYLGPASQAVDWFQSLGYPFDSFSNPADWIIDLVTTDFEKSNDVFGEFTMRNTEDIESASTKFLQSSHFQRTMLDRHWASLNRAMVHQAVNLVRESQTTLDIEQNKVKGICVVGLSNLCILFCRVS